MIDSRRRDVILILVRCGLARARHFDQKCRDIQYRKWFWLARPGGVVIG